MFVDSGKRTWEGKANYDRFRGQDHRWDLMKPDTAMAQHFKRIQCTRTPTNQSLMDQR